MEGDSSKNMTREAFGTFMQRFASASGLSFKDLSNFLLVMPRYNFDVDLNDPGRNGSWLICYAVTTLRLLRLAPALRLSNPGKRVCLMGFLCIGIEMQGLHFCTSHSSQACLLPQTPGCGWQLTDHVMRCQSVPLVYWARAGLAPCVSALHQYASHHSACGLALRPHLATDILAVPAGVKQLTKLIRKRLEERRREKKLSKLETAEQLKVLELP